MRFSGKFKGSDDNYNLEYGTYVHHTLYFQKVFYLYTYMVCKYVDQFVKVQDTCINIQDNFLKVPDS